MHSSHGCLQKPNYYLYVSTLRPTILPQGLLTLLCLDENMNFSPYPFLPTLVNFMFSRIIFCSTAITKDSVLCLQAESKNWKLGNRVYMIMTRQILIAAQLGAITYYEHTVFLASFFFPLEFLFALLCLICLYHILIFLPLVYLLVC